MKNGKTFKIRIVLNILIALTVFVVWYLIITGSGGTFLDRGFSSLKYFTILSNLFEGIVSIIWVIAALKCMRMTGTSSGLWFAERLKYVASAAVGLTFVTVMVFLGPLYGYPAMLEGGNLWLHLIIPLVAIGENIFLCDMSFTKKDNLLTMIPAALYGVVYLINNIVNGIGEWPDTNDWYGFLHWGYGGGVIAFAIVCIVSWLIGFIIRKTHKKSYDQKA